MTRTDLLNHLIKKHWLKSYLEIGVQNPAQNFDKIECQYKVSVDPDPNASATYCKSSDEFFYDYFDDEYAFDVTFGVNGSFVKYDLIFIDGLHTAEQVRKDFENALKILAIGGFIVLHDCNPQKEEHTIVPRPAKTGHWNGDVYKFAVSIASNWANYKTIDIDNGCGIFYNTFPQYSLNDGDISWDYFDKHRKELLNLISWDEFIKL